jgi:hypothetical protein
VRAQRCDHADGQLAVHGLADTQETRYVLV